MTGRTKYPHIPAEIDTAGWSKRQLWKANDFFGLCDERSRFSNREAELLEAKLCWANRTPADYEAEKAMYHSVRKYYGPTICLEREFCVSPEAKGKWRYVEAIMVGPKGAVKRIYRETYYR